MSVSIKENSIIHSDAFQRSLHFIFAQLFKDLPADVRENLNTYTPDVSDTLWSEYVHRVRGTLTAIYQRRQLLGDNLDVGTVRADESTMLDYFRFERWKAGENPVSEFLLTRSHLTDEQRAHEQTLLTAMDSLIRYVTALINAMDSTPVIPYSSHTLHEVYRWFATTASESNRLFLALVLGGGFTAHDACTLTWQDVTISGDEVLVWSKRVNRSVQIHPDFAAPLLKARTGTGTVVPDSHTVRVAGDGRLYLMVRGELVAGCNALDVSRLQATNWCHLQTLNPYETTPENRAGMWRAMEDIDPVKHGDRSLTAIVASAVIESRH